MVLKNKKGFTLIETMLALAIAGVLAVSLAYAVPVITGISDSSSDLYQGRIMTGIVMTRIEDAFRYADIMDIAENVPENLQPGYKYIYLSDGHIYEKSLGSSAVEISPSEGFEEYSASVVFQPANNKVVSATLIIYKGGSQICQATRYISVLNLGSRNITGTSSGMCVSYQTSMREPVPVAVITVTSLEDFIDENGMNLQMAASVYPASATNKGVVWSVNEAGYANITQEGLLTPLKNGLVTVKASALDGSGTIGTKQILISNQDVTITNLALTTSTGLTSLRYGGYSMMIIPQISPSDATNQMITWSVDNPLYASIDANGLLTSGGVKNKSVIVTATTNDGSGITATIEIRIVP